MGDLLFRILEEDPGRFVSGEEIGRRIGTSRAAVWKQVRTLRNRGFGIAGARLPASRTPRRDRGE
jgi:BirA family biotin operon repressor/biotin-[acetyl-CoA-carboxylase] ligase